MFRKYNLFLLLCMPIYAMEYKKSIRLQEITNAIELWNCPTLTLEEINNRNSQQFDRYCKDNDLDPQEVPANLKDLKGWTKKINIAGNTFLIALVCTVHVLESGIKTYDPSYFGFDQRIINQVWIDHHCIRFCELGNSNVGYIIPTQWCKKMKFFICANY